MEKMPLKQSVIHASKEAAELLSQKMLAMKGPKGGALIKRLDTATGFQLLAMMTENGEWKPCPIFEYAEREAGPIIYWDPRLVQIQEG